MYLNFIFKWISVLISLLNITLMFFVCDEIYKFFFGRLLSRLPFFYVCESRELEPSSMSGKVGVDF